MHAFLRIKDTNEVSRPGPGQPPNRLVTLSENKKRRSNLNSRKNQNRPLIIFQVSRLLRFQVRYNYPALTELNEVSEFLFMIFQEIGGSGENAAENFRNWLGRAGGPGNVK